MSTEQPRTTEQQLNERWDASDPKKFGQKLSAWDEGYAFAMSKIGRDLAPVAAELYRAMMGDHFDADKAGGLPGVLSTYGFEIEDFYYE